jgi:hypothetical protein
MERLRTQMFENGRLKDRIGCVREGCGMRPRKK